jgi:ketopantoate reductase
MQYRVLRNTAINSVIEPMTVYYACDIKGITSTPERIQVAKQLLREAGIAILEDRDMTTNC